MFRTCDEAYVGVAIDLDHDAGVYTLTDESGAVVFSHPHLTEIGWYARTHGYCATFDGQGMCCHAR